MATRAISLLCLPRPICYRPRPPPPNTLQSRATSPSVPLHTVPRFPFPLKTERKMLGSSLALAALASAAAAQSSMTPLVAKRFEYDNLPYKADTGSGERGPQSGYNRCNSTTAGPESLCQTAIINSLDE